MDWRIIIACLVVFGILPWALTFARKGIFHQIARGLMLAIVPVLIAMLMIPALRIARLRTINAALDEKSALATPPPAAATPSVRPPNVAGFWYPRDPQKLRECFEPALNEAKPEVQGDVMALVAPHAGFEYSGRVAAWAYKTIQGRKFARVLILAPSHCYTRENVIALPADSAFRTPLGDIPVNSEVRERLLQNPLFQTRSHVFDEEHAVEAQLVFLQAALAPGFEIIPMLTGRLDLGTVKSASESLLRVAGPDTLLVVSTDFTHYGPRYRYTPFTEDVEQNLAKLDMGAWEKVKAHDMEGLCDYVNETQATICGRCSLGILIGMMSDENKAHLLRYETSGKNEGDFTNSVSYVAGAVTGPWRKGADMNENEAGFKPLSDDDKTALLKLARGTLDYYLKNKAVPTAEDLGVAVTPAMRQIMGAFVTLHKQEALRGCIGEIAPRRELYKAVIAHAINAGANDYRFNPVSPEETAELRFEISALTPPAPVAGYRDIVIGKHGMVLDKNGRSAVFLPQVAPEQGWNLEQTLTHLAMKAGLSPDAWKENASFTVFEAIVFHE